MKSILIFIFVFYLSISGYGQIIVKPGPHVMAVHEANIKYTPRGGWRELDTSFNKKPLTYHFLYICVARWGFYNPQKDLYMILGTRGIRSYPGLLSDSAANNFYLSRQYLSHEGLIPLKENVVSSAMLREAHADDAAAYRIKLDTPFLGKYHYAKRFLLHRQDVADVTLNFVALNQSKEEEINQALKEMWGIIRFRPDSAFNPEFKISLVGKFRHLRPSLNTDDSAANAKSRKWMNFEVAMFNGKSALKAKKIERSRKNFLEASRILPDNASPIKSLFKMYLDRNQLDSALVYLKKLRKDYLLQNPKLLSEIKYGWAIWYEKKGRYDSAIVVNKQLLKLRPQNAVNIYLGIAENYRKMGKYETAIKKYEKVQQLNQQAGHPNNDYCTFQIGYCYEKLSDKKQAKKYFKKAEEKGYNLPEEVKEEYGL